MVSAVSDLVLRTINPSPQVRNMVHTSRKGHKVESIDMTTRTFRKPAGICSSTTVSQEAIKLIALSITVMRCHQSR